MVTTQLELHDYDDDCPSTGVINRHTVADASATEIERLCAQIMAISAIPFTAILDAMVTNREHEIRRHIRNQIQIDTRLPQSLSELICRLRIQLAHLVSNLRYLDQQHALITRFGDNKETLALWCERASKNTRAKNHTV